MARKTQEADKAPVVAPPEGPRTLSGGSTPNATEEGTETRKLPGETRGSKKKKV